MCICVCVYVCKSMKLYYIIYKTNSKIIRKSLSLTINLDKFILFISCNMAKM